MAAERNSQAVRKARIVQEAAPATSNPCCYQARLQSKRQVDELLLIFVISAKIRSLLMETSDGKPKTKDLCATVRPFLKPMSNNYKLQHSILQQKADRCLKSRNITIHMKYNAIMFKSL